MIQLMSLSFRGGAPGRLLARTAAAASGPSGAIRPRACREVTPRQNRRKTGPIDSRQNRNIGSLPRRNGRLLGQQSTKVSVVSFRGNRQRKKERATGSNTTEREPRFSV